MKTTHVLLVLILVLIAVGVGFYLGRQNTPLPSVTTETRSTESSDSAEGSSLSEESEMQAEGTTIDAGSLTDGQRKLLGILGINADEFTVTPEMEACAEGKLGRIRLDEIVAGDTPSFTEGAQLVACYR